MKKIAILLLLFLQLGSSQAQSYDNHPWCPPGARWVYRNITGISTTEVDAQYLRDTLVNSDTLKMIQIKYHVITGNYRQLAEEETRYFRYRNDSVWLWDGNRFLLQYAFETPIYQYWEVGGDSSRSFLQCTYPNITDTAQVMQWDTVAFLGKYFRRIHVKPGNYWTFGEEHMLYSQIIRNIGGIGGLFSRPNLYNYPNCVNELYSTLNLMCYTDSLRGSGNWGTTNAYCTDLFTALNVIPASNQKQIFKLSPNPTAYHATLKTDDYAVKVKRIVVTDVLGKLVAVYDNPNLPLQINIEHLPKGLYLCVIETDNNEWFNLKIMKS